MAGSARINILLLGASPRELVSIRVDDEVRGIRDRLDRSPSSGSVELVYEPAARATELSRYMAKHRPQVLHISCHGSRSGEDVTALVFEGRLCFDADTVLRDGADTDIPRLAEIQATVFDNRLDLARQLEAIVSDNTLSYGLAPLAIAVGQVLIDKLRQDSKTDPDRLPYLVVSLNNLSSRLSEAGRSAEALAAIQEAVEVYRTLAQGNPERFLPSLASCLGNLSNRLAELGRPTEVLEVLQEAVGYFRRLARAAPRTFTRDAVKALRVLGDRHAELGQDEEAQQARAEAAELEQ